MLRQFVKWLWAKWMMGRTIVTLGPDERAIVFLAALPNYRIMPEDLSYLQANFKASLDCLGLGEDKVAIFILDGMAIPTVLKQSGETERRSEWAG